MDVGIAMGAVPPFASMARRVRRLAESGFRSFWWPDHLVAFHSRQLWATGGLAELQPDPHAYADPFLCMAASADAAGDARIGVCVTDAIRRSPATLLQTVMTLDHLAPGRVVLGLGAGEYANYGPYGIGVKSPAARLEHAAEQIRSLLDDPGPDEAGAVLGLRPPEGSPGPQLWLAAHGPRGYALTGRLADGWIPNWLTCDAWHTGRDRVLDAARAAGRPDRVVTLGLSIQVVVQDDHDAAHALLEHPMLKAFALLLPPERFEAVGVPHPLGGGGLRHMVASLNGEALQRAAEAVPVEVVHDYMVHGTVDDVADAVAQYEGLEHLILWDPVPLVDLGAARSSAAGTIALAARLQS